MHGSYYFQVKSHQIWGGTTKQLWNITLTSNIITIPCIVLQCIIVSSFKHISILKFLQLYKPTYKQLLLYPSDHSRSTHSCRDITVLVWRTVWPLKYLVKPFRAFYTTEVTFFWLLSREPNMATVTRSSAVKEMIWPTPCSERAL